MGFTTKQEAIITMVLVIMSISMMLLLIGFIDYRIDNGKQMACEDEFGPEAEWVGLVTSDLDGVICETPDGELHARETLGTPHGSVGDYIDELAGLV